MALSNILSDKTKSLPSENELSNTATDMRVAYEWHYGDAEPKGTHVLQNIPLRNYRNDLRKGAADDARYKHNYILVDTFKLVGPQLAKLKG